MNTKSKIACVTGASGTVGHRIVELLIMKGYTVRVLNRKKWYPLEGVEVFCGTLEDEALLKAFTFGADYLYHCAAELKDETKMWSVNVEGTQRVIQAVKDSKIKHFLFISSAGVVGITDVKNVTEDIPCNPITIYEKTKWEAEKLVAKGINGCSVVILRPTNIVDTKQPGVLEYTVNRRWATRLMMLLRGGECAHIVHAKDVANAALHLSTSTFNRPATYFVSCDHDSSNTFSGLNHIHRSLINNKPPGIFGKKFSMPLLIPHYLRKFRTKKSNRGDVKYSSNKLINSGFRYQFNTKETVTDILSIIFGFTTEANEKFYKLQKKLEIENLVIVGASGFIGTSLVGALSERKDINLHLLFQKKEQLNKFRKISNAMLFKGSLFDVDVLNKMIKKDCTVVNLAYMEKDTRDNNILAIKNLSNACIAKKAKRLVHCSTAAVAGNVKDELIKEDTPCKTKTDYEINKLEIEQILTQSAKNNYELAILRPTSVFGPGGKNLIKLTDNLTQNRLILKYLRSCFSGRRNMNLVCLDNVISSILYLCENCAELERETFIISDDNNPFNNYRDIEKLLISKLNLRDYPIPRIPFPGILLTLLLRLIRRPITHTQRSFDCQKMLREGFEKTTTINDELDRFVEWYRTNYTYSR